MVWLAWGSCLSGSLGIAQGISQQRPSMPSEQRGTSVLQWENPGISRPEASARPSVQPSVHTAAQPNSSMSTPVNSLNPTVPPSDERQLRIRLVPIGPEPSYPRAEQTVNSSGASHGVIRAGNTSVPMRSPATGIARAAHQQSAILPPQDEPPGSDDFSLPPPSAGTKSSGTNDGSFAPPSMERSILPDFDQPNPADLNESPESSREAPSLGDDPFRNPFRRDSQPPSSTDPLPPLREPDDTPKSVPENKLRESEKDKENQKQKDIESESEKSTKPAPTSCDMLRSQVKARTIDKVSLDISPPFRPDILDKEKQKRVREDFLKRQKPRQWLDIHGRPLAYGTFEDIQFEKVIISGANGQKQRLSLADLSEPDLVQIADGWGLPRQCRLEPEQYHGRSFVPATFTWKASGLCHNPLYFEEVALERYGHSLGPIAQPVVSTAHFFGNIAVLPYKMGIHPLKECQYALGYYRPGNCAPWIIPPVPLSLRGALAETAVIGGGVLLFP